MNNISPSQRAKVLTQRSNPIPDTTPMMRRISRALIVWLAIIFVPASGIVLRAQTATGTISGSVHDSASALVVDAKIILVEAATGESRTTSSNSQGFYTFSFVPPGTYSLTVDKIGFKKFTQQSIDVTVGLGIAIDPILTVGQASETVTITSEESTLETMTSSLGQVIENRSIDNLPTNGRNSYEFATLVPGVNASQGFSQTAYDQYSDQFVSINGSRPNQNSFLLDGGVNTEPAFNGPGFYPSVDLVDQYKVQTNNFSAEFSNSGGGVVNVITKAGNNQFHGSGYEFYRSAGLGANNFFSNAANQPRAPFRFQQFGGTLGGPVKRKSNFFFFSYEGLRWQQGLTTVATVPTLLQRSGDFSQTYNSSGALIPIYDPFSTVADPSNPSGWSRTQFTGNVIPPGEFSKVASNMLPYIPLPNTPGTGVTNVNNFTSTTSYPIIKNDFSLRIDQVLPKGQLLFGRYSISDTSLNRPGVYGSSPDLIISSPTAGRDGYRLQQSTIQYSNPLRQDLVLELSSSFIRMGVSRLPPSYASSPSAVGLPFNSSNFLNVPCPFPSVGISGEGPTYSIGNFGGSTLIAYSGGFLRDAEEVIHEAANLTYVRGTQTLKFGGDFGDSQVATGKFVRTIPVFSFGTNFTQGPDPIADTKTGVGFASFMLGAGSGSITGPGEDAILHFRYAGVYFQDDWQVIPRLTLNLGARYDLNEPWFERYNRVTSWNATAASPLQVSGFRPIVGGLQFPGVNGASTYQFNPDHTNFSPRIGFSYSATTSTQVRGGFGLIFAPMNGGGFNSNAVPTTGFSAASTWVSTLNNATLISTFDNPFPNGFLLPVGSSQGLATFLGTSVNAMSLRRPTSYAEQWNLDIQQRLLGSLLIDLAYAGSRGLHLQADFDADQLPDSDLAMGAQLNQTVPNPFYGNPLVSTGALSKATVAQSQLLLPYPQFTGVTLNDGTTFGKSFYNALELNVKKQVSKGFSVTGAYTWSKLMDNLPPSTTGFPGGTYASGALQDYYNLRAEWAPAAFDATQYLAINGIWNLPLGRDREFLNSGGIVNLLVGGWQLMGIGSAETGPPQQITTASNTLFNNGGVQRANWNGSNPKMPGSAASKRNEYFNVSDFSAPAAFTYGNTARTLGYLRAPGVEDIDLSGIKNTQIGEKLTFQLRAEAFNLFNHVQFSPPNTVLASGATGVISSQFNVPRQIQLAGKFIW